MRTLNHKLLHDLSRHRAQFLAIAMVIAIAALEIIIPLLNNAANKGTLLDVTVDDSTPTTED